MIAYERFSFWALDNPILLMSGSPLALWINPILRAVLLLRSGLVLYCLRAAHFLGSG